MDAVDDGTVHMDVSDIEEQRLSMIESAELTPQIEEGLTAFYAALRVVPAPVMVIATPVRYATGTAS